MTITKLLIIAFASLTIFMFSCGNNNNSAKDGHNATKMVQTNTNSHNEKGELVYASGNIIVGCPMHKEMIGSEGDLCPKCNYMKMAPITWPLDGIDTVRVKTLPDYNPPKK